MSEAASHIADIIDHWLAFQAERRASEGLDCGPDTMFVCFDMPYHPTRAMLESWSEALHNIADRPTPQDTKEG